MDVSATCASSQMKERRKILIPSLHVTKSIVDWAASVTVLIPRQKTSHTAGNQPVCLAVGVNLRARIRNQQIRKPKKDSKVKTRGRKRVKNDLKRKRDVIQGR